MIIDLLIARLNTSASPSYPPSLFPASSEKMYDDHASIHKQTYRPKLLVNNKLDGWRSRVHPSPTPVDHNHPELGADDDGGNVIALIDQPVQNLSTMTHLPSTLCSSCGSSSTLIAGRQHFIQLSPCRHVLCPTCLSSLINATSNDPPRDGACFACNGLATDFVGVSFDSGPGAPTSPAIPAAPAPTVGDPLNQFKTPERSNNRFTRFTDTDRMELSPFRTIDWSTDMESPGTTPGSLKRTG